MTRREWHLEALAAARRAQFPLSEARQAMIDCRKALLNASDEPRAAEIHRILMESIHSPPALQALVVALQNDPILDEPKDLMSAGEVSVDGED